MTDDALRARLQSTLGTAYRLERELGGGGMSRVFVAEETVLARTVVIKVMSPELAEGLNVERFRREIQVAARLQHPHIVPLLAAGESGGLPYFTMPFIDGESLRNRLAKGGELPVGEAVRVLREVASALSYAHANGVVHRDIKPDNVLISGGSAMVTDFGVAKALNAAATMSGQGQLTQFGVALGTPAYMAPEQAAADPATDHRADLYAFGAMSYELLTGDPPFAGRPAQAMLAAHAIETPESVTRRRPAIPQALGAVVMRCLEKRPADRPQSADEIIRVLDSIPTSSGTWTPTNAAVPAGRGSRRPSHPRVAAVAAAFLAVAAGAWTLLHRQRFDTPKGQTMLAVLPFENQGPASDAYFADGLTEAITNRLASLHNLGVIDRRSAGQYRNTTKSVRQIGRELGVQYVLEGTVRWASNEKGAPLVQISPSLVSTNDLTTKPAGGPYQVSPADVFDVQTKVATEVADALNVTLNGDEQKALVDRPTANPRAYDAYMRGEAFDQTINELSPENIRQAMGAFGEATHLDPSFALAFAKLADAQFSWAILDISDTSRLASAKRSLDSAFALKPGLADGHAVRAFYLDFFLKDKARAMEELTRAQALRPNDANLLSRLGSAQIVQGQTTEGFANLAKAVKLDPRALVTLQRVIGQTYNYHRYAETERYADRYIALAPTSSIGYSWRINAEIDGRGDTAAGRRTMDTAEARGVVMTVTLATQYTNFGRTGWEKLQHMSLEDAHAGQFLDSSTFYIAKRLAVLALGDQQAARAYGDSVVRIGLSPRLTGPLIFARYQLLGWGYSFRGDRPKAMQQVISLERYADSLSADDPQRANFEQTVAAVFGTIGMADSAIAHLRRLMTLKTGFSLWSARTDITYWPLRGNPAWERFLAGS